LYFFYFDIARKKEAPHLFCNLTLNYKNDEEPLKKEITIPYNIFIPRFEISR
jgi:hypothetical protein